MPKGVGVSVEIVLCIICARYLPHWLAGLDPFNRLPPLMLGKLRAASHPRHAIFPARALPPCAHGSIRVRTRRGRPKPLASGAREPLSYLPRRRGERKSAPFSVIIASVLKRSRVERANLSRRVTTTSSPSASWAITRCSWARSFCAARRLPKHLLSSSGAKLPHLGVNALPVCRYPSVARSHGLLLQQISATKKVP